MSVHRMKRPSTGKPCILYVAAEMTHSNETGFVKIGTTKDTSSLLRRQDNLDTGNPRDVTMMRVWHTDLAGFLEQRILKGLAERRVGRKDWLDFTDYKSPSEQLIGYVEALLTGKYD